MYYILYPRSKTGSVKVWNKPPPTRAVTGYAFYEGPFRTIKAVTKRLNQMGIPSSKRPMKFRR